MFKSHIDVCLETWFSGGSNSTVVWFDEFEDLFQSKLFCYSLYLLLRNWKNANIGSNWKTYIFSGWGKTLTSELHSLNALGALEEALGRFFFFFFHMRIVIPCHVWAFHRLIRAVISSSESRKDFWLWYFLFYQKKYCSVIVSISSGLTFRKFIYDLTMFMSLYLNDK